MTETQTFQNLVFHKMNRKMVAQEIKILRKQELKLQRQANKAELQGNKEKVEKFRSARDQVYLARKNDSHYVSRVMHVANAFLTGRPYYQVESKVMRTNLPKILYLFWRDVAEEVSSVLNSTDHRKVFDQLIAWRNKHPGYQAMEFYQKNGVSKIEQLNSILDNFGDYWLYVEYHVPNKKVAEAA